MMMPMLSPLETAAPLLAVGWAALFLAPFIRSARTEVVARGVPMLALGVLTVAFLGVLGPDHASPFFLVYLGVTLMFGLWQYQLATNERMPRILLLPCLGLTLVYAPSGLIAFTGLRLCQRILALPGA